MTVQQVEQGKEPASVLPTALQNAPRIEAAPAAASTLVPTPPAVIEPYHVEFAEFHEDYVRHYIQFADAKAGACFTVISAVLGYLVSKDEIQKLILEPAWNFRFEVAAAALVVLLVSAAFSFAIIAPRLGSKSAEGIVFFGAVADRESSEAFIMDVAASSEAGLTTARLKHCFDISKICARKYLLLRAAIWSAMPGLALALAALLLVRR